MNARRDHAGRLPGVGLRRPERQPEHVVLVLRGAQQCIYCTAEHLVKRRGKLPFVAVHGL